jgi:Protein of unknown function (DUF732)
MSPYVDPGRCDDLVHRHRMHGHSRPIRPRRLPRSERATAAGTKCGAWLAALVVVAAAVGPATLTLAARAYSAPAPEVEYTYDVMVRRHYNFPSDDAIGYGHGICDKVSGGESYAQVMGEVKRDVTPNDEFAANYLVSNAVNLLCPDQIWQLRNSAGGYRPPAG